MPELPEVEVVRQQLLEAVVGKTIQDVEIFHTKTVGHDESFIERLRDETISDIERIGKLMIFHFKGHDDLFMLAHLKMTGQFFYVKKNRHRRAIVGGGHSMTEADVAEFPGRHTRVAFHFTDSTSLYFNDMRLFGYTKLADAKKTALARSQFGPEPHATDFDLEWFVERVRKRKAPIKAVLLDQSFVAGLGNIYVDEALWRAQVRPTRRADRLTRAEARALGVAAGDVLRESIAVKGTTFQSFKDTTGHAGNFSQYLNVFGKQGTPCSRCSSAIKKIRTAGRGTHFCPGCQK